MIKEPKKPLKIKEKMSIVKKTKKKGKRKKKIK